MSRILITAALIAMPLCGVAQAQDAGRLLASNCFQCHGTNGKGGFDSLAGKSAAELFNEMKEMQGSPATAEWDKEIMVVHANSYTDAELKLIADFFSKQ